MKPRIVDGKCRYIIQPILPPTQDLLKAVKTNPAKKVIIDEEPKEPIGWHLISSNLLQSCSPNFSLLINFLHHAKNKKALNFKSKFNSDILGLNNDLLSEKMGLKQKKNYLNNKELLLKNEKFPFYNYFQMKHQKIKAINSFKDKGAKTAKKKSISCEIVKENYLKLCLDLHSLDIGRRKSCQCQACKRKLGVYE